MNTVIKKYCNFLGIPGHQCRCKIDRPYRFLRWVGRALLFGAAMVLFITASIPAGSAAELTFLSFTLGTFSGPKKVKIEVKFRDGSRRSITTGIWGDNDDSSEKTFPMMLDNSRRPEDIMQVTISSLGIDIGGLMPIYLDWNLNYLEIEFVSNGLYSKLYSEPTDEFGVFRFSDMPLKRFTAFDKQFKVKVCDECSFLEFTFGTGKDNLRGDHDNVSIDVELMDGTHQIILNANNGYEWGSDTDHTILMKLDGPVRHTDIMRVKISTPHQGGLSPDNWDLASLKIEFVNSLGDRMLLYEEPKYECGYEHAMRLKRFTKDDDLFIVDIIFIDYNAVYRTNISDSLSRYVQFTVDGEINLYLSVDKSCNPWHEKYKDSNEPEDNYCGPTAVKNLMYWYGKDNLSYDYLGEYMRTNTWEDDPETAAVISAVCGGVCAGWCSLCGACVLVPPACTAACLACGAGTFACTATCITATYAGLNQLKMGTLPQNIKSALQIHAPSGYHLVSSQESCSQSLILKSLSNGNPVVALIYKSSALHWVVLTGWYKAEDGTMKLLIANNYEMSWCEFVDAWSIDKVTDVDIAEDVLNALGVVPYVMFYYESSRSPSDVTNLIDRDRDGILGNCDNCPLVKNTKQEDFDKDDVGDVCDNCPFSHNPDQSDNDNDTRGDVCDPDDDNDGVKDEDDNCPLVKNTKQEDFDKDDMGDVCDPDDDNDGVKDEFDNCSKETNPNQRFCPNNTDIDPISGLIVGVACDNGDDDDDCIQDEYDNCPRIFNPDQYDNDGTQGIVSCWKFDEGAGTIAGDCVDRNPGTVYGATWTAGKVGGALSFDGVDDYVEIPYSADFNLSSFTLEAWVKFSQNDAPARIISRSSGGNPTDGYSYFSLANAFGKVSGGVQGEGQAYTSSVSTPSSTFADNNWYLCSFVRDVEANEISIYVDGFFYASHPDSSPGDMEHNDKGIIIGSSDGSELFFEGLVDEVAIYNRTLSEEELQQHYQNSSSGYSCSDGIGDACDNCPEVYNPTQDNTNALEEDYYGWPKTGDVCDPRPFAELYAYSTYCDQDRQGPTPRFSLSILASASVPDAHTRVVTLESCRCESPYSCNDCLDDVFSDYPASYPVPVSVPNSVPTPSLSNPKMTPTPVYIYNKWSPMHVVYSESSDVVMHAIGRQKCQNKWRISSSSICDDSDTTSVLYYDVTPGTSDDGSPSRHEGFFAWCPPEKGTYVIRALHSRMLPLESTLSPERFRTWTIVNAYDAPSCCNDPNHEVSGFLGGWLPLWPLQLGGTYSSYYQYSPLTQLFGTGTYSMYYLYPLFQNQLFGTETSSMYYQYPPSTQLSGTETYSMYYQYPLFQSQLFGQGTSSMAYQYPPSTQLSGTETYSMYYQYPLFQSQLFGKETF